MLLTPRLAHHFRSVVRQRGDVYARARRVRVESRGAMAVASVRGSGGVQYRVQVTALVDRGRPAIAAACECPYFDRDYCKHLWAVLVELERTDWEPPRIDPAGARRFDLRRIGEPQDDDELDDSDDEFAAFGEDDLDEPEEVAPPRWVASRTPLGAERRDRPWQERIRALATRSDPAASGRAPGATFRALPVVYLLNADAPSHGLAPVRIAFGRRRVRQDGSAGALMPASIDLLEASRAADGEEHAAVLQLLTLAQAEAALGRAGYGYGSWATDPHAIRTSSVSIPTAFLDSILPRLAATGRLALVSGGSRAFGAGAAEPERIRLDAGPPLALRLRVERSAAGGFELCGRFVREGEELALAAVRLLLGPSRLVAGDALVRVDMSGALQLVSELRRDPLRVSARDLDRFVAALAEMPGDTPLEFAAEVGWSIDTRMPLCRLRFDEIESRRELAATVAFGYAPDEWIAPEFPGRRIADRATRTMILRDREAERRAMATLRDLGFGLVRPRFEGEPVKVAVPEAAFESVAADLVAKGWILEVAGARIRSAGRSHACVRSGVDFFDLEGAVEYGDVTAPFPALLEAIEHGSRFVRLADGSRGLVPSAWRERSASLARLGEAHDGVLRFGRAQVGFLAELLDAQDASRSDRRFAALRRKISRFAGVTAVDPPASFRGDLRPYQREGLGWLGFLRDFGLGGCLADDMGLGKTVQVLALLGGRRRARGPRRTSLVVAPKSVVGGWVEEAARFVPSLRVLRYEGNERAALREQLASHDLVVTTYGTLLRDAEHLAKHRFDYAILDEAQAIKNAASRTARAAKLLRAEHRLALTGTPVENHLGELASQLEFLNPGMLGRTRGFEALVRGRADEASVALLQRALRPLLLRRTKQQVLGDLPPKTEQTLRCPLEGRQRRDYDELRRHYQASLAKRIGREGIERSKIYVLEALLRLRQAACHPALLDPRRAGEGSAKLDLLYERLDEVVAEGHKALVFSQFTSFLAEVRRGLDARGVAYEYLDGRTRDRRARIERFGSDAACPLFLVSLKAGGTGLNLTAADYVFLLDPWWNPAVEAQAIDRTHRIGQTRPVFAYRIVASDTVEEKILELQERKRSLARSIFASEEGFVAGLDADDLRRLLG